MSTEDAPNPVRWTGGAYSAYRVALAVLGGGAFFARWAGGVPDGLGSALALGVWTALGLLAVGYRDRWAALAVAAGGVAIEWGGDLPLAVEPWFLVALFLLHAATPEGPYGSLTARGRVDPGGSWRLPEFVTPFGWMLAIGWILWVVEPMVLGWACVLIAGVLFVRAPLVASAFFLGVVALVWWLQAGFWNLGTVVTILLTGITFSPASLPRRGGDVSERVFFDGACGLCHGAVRFLIAEDPGKGILRYAPLGGPTFQAAVPKKLQAHLPDSILVLTDRGELLDRSRAILHALGRLGGLWRIVAFLGEAVPLVLRDHLYDLIAKRRHRWFATPDEACPLLPPHLAERFEA